MKKVVLDNGLTVIFEQKKGNSVVVEVLVKVGSNREEKKERGISHFIEHMIFEGTKNRPSNWLISNEIEKIGGEFNAYTTNERTCFYIKVLKKHLTKAINVLADILQNSLFTEEAIVREKNIVLKEIDLVNDEPRYYQWESLQKNIFDKHPTKHPVYGDKKIIKNLTRKEVVDYYQKYYLPNNMIISIVGDVKNWKSKIEKSFISEKGKVSKINNFIEPLPKKNKVKIVKKKIVNTYTVMGFKTVPQKHPDSYILEVINGVLGRGQSGKMFAEIRAKKGLAYDVGTQNINEETYGYFAIYATIDKKNINLVKRLCLKEIEKLKKITKEDLQEAKDYVEGDYLLEVEDSQKVADQLLFWEHVQDAKLINQFIKKIRKVNVNDVRKVINKYFNHHTFVALKGK